MRTVQGKKLGITICILLLLPLSGAFLSHIWEPRTWQPIRDTGTVGRAPTGGCMAIISENEHRYDHYEVVNLPSAFQERGTHISFIAREYNGRSFCMWGKMIEIIAIQQSDQSITSFAITLIGLKFMMGLALILTGLSGAILITWEISRKASPNSKAEVPPWTRVREIHVVKLFRDEYKRRSSAENGRTHSRLLLNTHDWVVSRLPH